MKRLVPLPESLVFCKLDQPGKLHSRLAVKAYYGCVACRLAPPLLFRSWCESVRTRPTLSRHTFLIYIFDRPLCISAKKKIKTASSTATWYLVLKKVCCPRMFDSQWKKTSLNVKSQWADHLGVFHACNCFGGAWHYQ